MKERLVTTTVVVIGHGQPVAWNESENVAVTTVRHSYRCHANGMKKKRDTHPDIVIDIDPVAVDLLAQAGLVREVAHLLPRVHLRARLENGRNGSDGGHRATAAFGRTGQRG